MTETRASIAFRIALSPARRTRSRCISSPTTRHVRHPRRQAQHRRAGAAADIEHQLMGLGRHRGGEENRVDRDPIAFGG